MTTLILNFCCYASDMDTDSVVGLSVDEIDGDVVYCFRCASFCFLPGCTLLAEP